MAKILIGRNPHQGNGQYKTVTVHNDFVSETHAEISQINDKLFFIEDESSVNGTYINSWKVRKANFSINDELKLGPVVVDFKKELKKLSTTPRIHRADLSPKFNQLETIYKDYDQTTQKINKKDLWLGVGVRFSIMALVYLLSFAAAKWIEKNGENSLAGRFESHYSAEKTIAKCTMAIEMAQELDSTRIPSLFPNMDPTRTASQILVECASIKAAKERNSTLANILHLLGGAAALCLAIAIKPKGSGKTLAKLKQKFEDIYTCPNCHKFLGNISWKDLSENGHCPRCNQTFKRF